MQLGLFSLSINVKNIEKSLEFYEKLGFKIIDGGHINEHFKDTEEQKWRILSSHSLKIGLFQGMFTENMLTFNPKSATELQNNLKQKSIEFIQEIDEKSGMKTFMLKDPDGNIIMFDELPE